LDHDDLTLVIGLFAGYGALQTIARPPFGLWNAKLTGYGPILTSAVLVHFALLFLSLALVVCFGFISSMLAGVNFATWLAAKIVQANCAADIYCSLSERAGQFVVFGIIISAVIVLPFLYYGVAGAYDWARKNVVRCAIAIGALWGGFTVFTWVYPSMLVPAKLVLFSLFISAVVAFTASKLARPPSTEQI
jgi:hypothetical protein